MAKNLAVLSVLALTVGFSASASITSLEGTYTSTKEISYFGYENESDCKENDGKWIDETCMLQVADEVKVTRNETGAYEIEITTAAHNDHTCAFKGQASAVNGNTLVATAAVEEWSPSEKKSVNKTCRVEATFSSTADSVSINASDECQYFCGASAELSIEKAVKN